MTVKKSSIKKIKKFSTKDKTLSRFQSTLETTLAPLSKIDILNGVLLKDVNLLSASATNVSHKLNRDYTGWIVTRKNAEADVWEGTSTFKNKFILLSCSNDVTVDLWVF